MELILKRLLCWTRKYCKIKLKNKLSKRLLPFKVINGKIEINEDIFFENENVVKS